MWSLDMDQAKGDYYFLSFLLCRPIIASILFCMTNVNKFYGQSNK